MALEEALEPATPVRGPGRIILLNGASSSGKSTLAQVLQELLDEPFWHVSSDKLVESGFLPQRRHPRGDRQIGEGRTHVSVDGIHTFGPYDLEVDTTAGVSRQLAESVISAWRTRTPARALDTCWQEPEPAI